MLTSTPGNNESRHHRQHQTNTSVSLLRPILIPVPEGTKIQDESRRVFDCCFFSSYAVKLVCWFLGLMPISLPTRQVVALFFSLTLLHWSFLSMLGNICGGGGPEAWRRFPRRGWQYSAPVCVLIAPLFFLSYCVCFFLLFLFYICFLCWAIFLASR